MLVLSRKLDEIIDVTAPNGERLKIQVVRLNRDAVRIGIDAPGAYRIRRREVTELIAKEREQQERQDADE